ncbi:hypothetical protein [Microtetraspora malaysiensis]|uniref:Uncharacterized protein n=1 Tax=Microtetraspora malaysiensis TaxID=161358 RepID=A0ABW6SHK3_9ACTN
MRSRIAGPAFISPTARLVQDRIAGMRQDLVHTAAEHDAPAEEQRHQARAHTSMRESAGAAHPGRFLCARAELAALGVKVAASTVWEILKQEGLDPAPRLSMRWTDFQPYRG